MELRRTIETGIKLKAIAPRLIPYYEEREAALFGGYRWIDWVALPYDERVLGVAHYRVHRLIEFHQAEAAAEDAEKRSEAARRAAESRAGRGRR